MIGSTIETNNFILRFPSVDDVSALHQALEETLPDLQAFPNTWPWVVTVDPLLYAKKYCTSAKFNCDQNISWSMVIVEKNTLKLLGSIEVHRFDWAQRVWEIGFWTRHSCQNLGVMSEVLTTFFSWMKNHYPTYQIVIGVESDNQASLAVARKLGMKWQYQFTNPERNSTVFEIFSAGTE